MFTLNIYCVRSRAYTEVRDEMGKIVFPPSFEQVESDESNALLHITRVTLAQESDTSQLNFILHTNKIVINLVFYIS